MRALAHALPLVALVSLLTVAATPVRADTRKAKESFKRGMAAYVLEHWDDAIHDFEEGYQEEPQPAFLYNIARSHAKAGRSERAIAYYRKYLALSPRASDRSSVEAEIVRLEPLAEAERRAAEEAAQRAAEEKAARDRAAANLGGPSLGLGPGGSAGPEQGGLPPGALPPGPSAPVDAPRPWYKRWPVWVGVGAAVVLIAGAVAVGIVASRPSELVLPKEGLP